MTDDEVRALLDAVENDGADPYLLAPLADEVWRRGEVIATYEAALETLRTQFASGTNAALADAIVALLKGEN